MKIPKECSGKMKDKGKLHNRVTTEAKLDGSRLECEKFSTCIELVRVAAYEMRAVKVCRGNETLAKQYLTLY